MLRVLVPATAAALLLTACGGGDTTTTVTATSTTTVATTAPASTGAPTSTATTGGIDPMDDASTRPVHVEATNRRTALLTDVRVARHEGYDRVVFTFADALPGYDVRYVGRPVRQDGSGRAVPLAGGPVLRVRMENALDADLSKPSAPLTYTGPQRITPGTPEIAELARVGGFEGVLTWAVGVRDRVDFRVATLRSPPRLVLDVRNH